MYTAKYFTRNLSRKVSVHLPTPALLYRHNSKTQVNKKVRFEEKGADGLLDDMPDEALQMPVAASSAQGGTCGM